MSTSLIRCLLAVYALSEAYAKIASKDVAHLLGVKRPTVHRSLTVLQEKGLVQKELYGDIHLTEQGRTEAARLEKMRDDLALLLAHRLELPPDEGLKAAFALMSGLNGESLSRLQQMAEHSANPECCPVF